jgi:hypothetical protein
MDAEEKEIKRLIVQQDARIIFALRKGKEICVEAEEEALRLRRLLSEIGVRKRTLFDAQVATLTSAPQVRSKQDTEKNRVRRKNRVY